MSSDRPTKKQQALLQFISDFIREHGYGPSYREIMRGLDYRSVSTVAVHVDGLIARGWLRKTSHSARSLEVTSPHASLSIDSKSTDIQTDINRSIPEALSRKCDELLASSDSELESIDALIKTLRLLDFGKIADKYASKREQFIQKQI